MRWRGQSGDSWWPGGGIPMRWRRWFWFQRCGREVGGEVVYGFDLGFDPELFKRGGLGWWFLVGFIIKGFLV